MKRTLSLKRETLSDLTSEELATVQGGIPTFDGPICYVIGHSGVALCTRTVIQDTCWGTRD